MTYALPEPWLHEPKKAIFILHDFACVILSPRGMNLCGYVGLPRSHKYFGKHYDDIPVEVHGGLTYASDRIHKVENTEFWWIGFDCAHSNDYIIGVKDKVPGTYRTFGYVFAQLQSLTMQLQETTS